MKSHEIFQLNEVAMSPTALRNMASAVNARVGIEFEMIVSDLSFSDSSVDPMDFEPEMDYSIDREPTSIDDIIEFFDSEYADQSGLRTLKKKLSEQYKTEAMGFFMSYRGRYINSWHQTTEAGKEQYKNSLFSFLQDRGFDEHDSAAVLQAYEDSLQFSPDEVDDRMASNKFYQEFIELKPKFDKVWNDWVETNISQIFNDWEKTDLQTKDADEVFKFFIEERGFDMMSDIHERFTRLISWPTQSSPENLGDISELEDLGYDFKTAIGMPTSISTKYHGAERRPGVWAIEPDSSLTADEYRDKGMEFISPILMLNEVPSIMAKIIQWAKNRGCYTNRSTGLHMNVSIAGKDFQNLDYTKLVLFLGDQYILNQFGRRYNIYCESALAKIESTIYKAKPEKIGTLLDLVKKSALEDAGSMIHGKYTDKYTSVHLHPDHGYVEFRSPGGDWLKQDFNALMSTLYRFVVALDIALDPNKFQREYATKLYKLISPANTSPYMSLMSKYQAGLITKAEFIAAVKKTPKQQETQPTKSYEIHNKLTGGVLRGFTKPESEAVKYARDYVLANGRNPAHFVLVDLETYELYPLSRS